jgi:hypothetical protein
LPRDLADVLHYFLPELEDESKTADPIAAPSETIAEPDRVDRGNTMPVGKPSLPAVPILAVPIGDRDVVRAALTWNIAVETARLGKRVIVLAPESETRSALWPDAGIGPLGTELLFHRAQNLDQLAAEAARLSIECAGSKGRSAGALFVRVPPQWLIRQCSTEHPIPWWLLLSSPNHKDLSEAYDLAATIQTAQSTTESTPNIGITIHGVSSVNEARQAYEHLSRRCATQIGLELISYGLLVDDLHVYRAIAAQRPIGLAHPQAPATRALMDVARLLSEDAERLADG